MPMLLGYAGYADVEPHGRVERRSLRVQQVREFGPEQRGSRRIREVAVAFAPLRNRADDAINYLSQRGFPGGSAQGAPEVLLGQDVGGVLGPIGGYFHAGLLESHRSVAVVDQASVAALPGDAVGRILQSRWCPIDCGPEVELFGGQSHANHPIEILSWSEPARPSARP